MSPTFSDHRSTIATTLAGPFRGGEDASARITPRNHKFGKMILLDLRSAGIHVRSMTDVEEDSIAPAPILGGDWLAVFAVARCFYPPVVSMIAVLHVWAEIS